jgi:hypothetical protein
MLPKIQRFINYCLRKIINIRWFDKVRNEDFWQGASQDPINTQIKKEEMGMDWPHTEETTKQHHQTGPQMVLIRDIREVFVSLVGVWTEIKYFQTCK